MKANGKIGSSAVQVSDNIEQRFETDYYYFQNLNSTCLCLPITVYIFLYLSISSLCVEVSQSCLYMSGCQNLDSTMPILHTIQYMWLCFQIFSLHVYVCPNMQSVCVYIPCVFLCVLYMHDTHLIFSSYHCTYFRHSSAWNIS